MPFFATNVFDKNPRHKGISTRAVDEREILHTIRISFSTSTIFTVVNTESIPFRTLRLVFFFLHHPISNVFHRDGWNPWQPLSSPDLLASGHYELDPQLINRVGSCFTPGTTHRAAPVVPPASELKVALVTATSPSRSLASSTVSTIVTR